jgi:very-short-patch-repair endonuclease
MEIALMAGFLYYKLRPTPQAPFGPFDVDFLFPDELLAVEVDGREWHDPQRDRTRDEILARQYGLTVHRITGRQVFQDPLACVRELLPLLESAA